MRCGKKCELWCIYAWKRQAPLSTRADTHAIIKSQFPLSYTAWGYSSVVEHSTADREVPGSNPGAPSLFFFFPHFSSKNFFSALMEVKLLLIAIKHFLLLLKQHRIFFLSGRWANLFILYASRWLAANSNCLIPQRTAKISVFVCQRRKGYKIEE